MIFCPPFIIFGLTLLTTTTKSVGGCSVYPSNVVVTVGEAVILTCSTNEGSSIYSWKMLIDLTRYLTVYAATVYGQGGLIQHKKRLAEGYFAAHPANNETILYINKTAISQAGLYVCTCSDELRGTADASVVVLGSEPKLTADYSVSDGDPVTFSCSIYFNAYSDHVSCELKIEDASGSTVARSNESALDNGLTSCNLKYAIIANASFDQWHTCNVSLSTKSGGIIMYSRVLNATVDQWQLISSTTEYFSHEGSEAKNTDEGTQHLLAIGLSVTICVVIVIIIAVVYCIVRSKKKDKLLIKQLGMGQPAQDSSNTCAQRSASRYDANRIGNPIPNDGYYAEDPIYNEIKAI